MDTKIVRMDLMRPLTNVDRIGAKANYDVAKKHVVLTHHIVAIRNWIQPVQCFWIVVDHTLNPIGIITNWASNNPESFIETSQIVILSLSLVSQNRP